MEKILFDNKTKSNYFMFILLGIRSESMEEVNSQSDPYIWIKLLNDTGKIFVAYDGEKFVAKNKLVLNENAKRKLKTLIDDYVDGEISENHFVFADGLCAKLGQPIHYFLNSK